DIMSLLLNCPIGKQVWDAAVAANGGAEPELLNSGTTGGGMCEPIPAKVSFATVGRIPYTKGMVIPPGGKLKETALKEEFIEMIGNDIGVQILIMELGNLSKRYDFFNLDYQMNLGNVGLQDYIERTERIEYDGGVSYVINAYNACHARWN